MSQQQEQPQPVNPAPNMMGVKVTRIGGRVNDLFLQQGSTVRQALAAAKLTVEHGIQLRVNNQQITNLDQPLVNGDIVLLMPQIAGGD